jgi:threonine 3-dehydrogenase
MSYVKRMLALIKAEAGPGLRFDEVPVPDPAPGQAVVRVEATSICGTDLHIYRWDEWAQTRIRAPQIIGHEFCGTVVASDGSRTDIAEGEYVSAEGHISCTNCFHCLTGQAHICDHVDLLGVDVDGCFAEYVAVPTSNLWTLDPSIPREVGAIHDPLGNAVHTALAADLPGRSVAITGCGSIGLFAVAICSMAGAAFIIATDISDTRLELARRLGADLAINVQREDPVRQAKAATGGLGVEVLLEMSGFPQAIYQGFAMLRGGGTACMLGIPSRPVEIDLTRDIIFKAATVKGINGRRMFHTWYQMTALLKRGLDVSSVITHRMPMARYEEAFELLGSGRCGKIVFWPNGIEPSPEGAAAATLAAG